MRGQRPRLSVAFRCVTAWLVILAVAWAAAPGAGLVGESEGHQWTPLLGKWYLWTDPTGVQWNALEMARSAGSNTITFLSRCARADTTEHFRAIMFSEGQRVMPLPYNIGGKQKIDVYWYDRIGDEGSFFRLSDHWGEYLISVREKTTSMILRMEGRTFVGKLKAGEDKISTTYSREEGALVVSICGRRAREIRGSWAAEEGKKIGEIQGR